MAMRCESSIRRLLAAVATTAAVACSSVSKTEIRYDGRASAYVIAPAPEAATEPDLQLALEPRDAPSDAPRCTVQSLARPRS